VTKNTRGKKPLCPSAEKTKRKHAGPQKEGFRISRKENRRGMRKKEKKFLQEIRDLAWKAKRVYDGLERGLPTATRFPMGTPEKGTPIPKGEGQKRPLLPPARDSQEGKTSGEESKRVPSFKGGVE